MSVRQAHHDVNDPDTRKRVEKYTKKKNGKLFLEPAFGHKYKLTTGKCTEVNKCAAFIDFYFKLFFLLHRSTTASRRDFLVTETHSVFMLYIMCLFLFIGTEHVRAEERENYEKFWKFDCVG